MKFRTPWNQDEFLPVRNEKGHDITDEGKRKLITLPDQSLTIRQILERHRVGASVMLSVKTPMYYGDDLKLPDLEGMDLAEIEQLKRGLVERETELKDKFKSEYDAYQRDKADKRQKAEKLWLQQQAEKLGEYFKEKRTQPKE